MGRILLAFVLFALPVCAQSAAPAEDRWTLGMANGRLWSGLGPGEKSAYLVAVWDVVTSLEGSVPSGNLDSFSAPGFKVGAVLKSIDQFYATPENALIPIVFVM